MLNKQKVVVIGHGYTSRLGIIRSLGAIGCDITVIVMVFHSQIGRFIRFDGGRPVDCYSKYVNRVLYCHAKDKDNLIDILLNKCVDPDQKVVIVPDSDFSASVIDSNQERLSNYFLFPHINHVPGAIEHWMQKTVQKQLARDLGINVADGRVIPVKNQQYTIPEGVKYPCFAKPLRTINGGKGFLNRCNDENELRNVLNCAGQKHDTDVLVEDFISIDTEFAVVGFSDGKNAIIPGVIQFIVNSPSHFGIAREGRIIPIDGFEDIIEQFKSFVVKIGFCGLFDIDFFKSKDKLFFCEMNLRFGGSGYAYTCMGANLPAMFVKFMQGETFLDANLSINNSSTYVNERMCIDDWYDSFIDKREMQSIIDSADIHFILDEDDPKPGESLKRYIFCQGIKRKVRLLISRIH